jgi:hypothetical protein
MGLYRSVVSGTIWGQTVQVIHGWRTGNPTSSGEAGALAARVGQYWGTDVLPAMSTAYSTTHVDCFGMDDPTAHGSAAAVYSGANSGQPFPAFSVVNVELLTPLRGRSYRGRYGIPGVTASMIDATDANLLDPGYQAGLQTEVQNFRSDMSGGATPGILCVISTVHNGVVRPTPISTDVTQQIVKQPLGSRVSRKGA